MDLRDFVWEDRAGVESFLLKAEADLFWREEFWREDELSDLSFITWLEREEEVCLREGISE